MPNVKNGLRNKYDFKESCKNCTNKVRLIYEYAEFMYESTTTSTIKLRLLQLIYE